MSQAPAVHEYMGQKLTVNQLAALAGCTYIVMYYRLRKGHSTTVAVSMGPSRRAPKPPVKAWQGPKIQPKHAGPVLPANAPVAPANSTAAPTVSQAMPADPRYTPTHVPSFFGDLRPGQYLPSDTHLSRVYGGRQ